MLSIASPTKILVRNLEPAIHEALSASAAANDRSVEAEARQALRAWVQPSLLQKERSARRADVARRLNTALQAVNEVSHTAWRASHVAQLSGQSHAETVEDWFIGQVEPSFAELASVARLLGVEPSWLQHGDGAMFPVRSTRLSSDPGEAALWLLNMVAGDGLDVAEQPKPQFPTLQRLLLVRSAGKDGSLAIVKQWDSYRCTVFTTMIHVSDMIGSGGEAALAELAVTLELLYKIGPLSRYNVVVTSWILPERDFRSLTSGAIHPLSLNVGQADQPWWEDFWDPRMSASREYWPGWKEITSRMQRVVAMKSNLAKQLAQVRDGSHPVLTDLQRKPVNEPVAEKHDQGADAAKATSKD